MYTIAVYTERLFSLLGIRVTLLSVSIRLKKVRQMSMYKVPTHMFLFPPEVSYYVLKICCIRLIFKNCVVIVFKTSKHLILSIYDAILTSVIIFDWKTCRFFPMQNVDNINRLRNLVTTEGRDVALRSMLNGVFHCNVFQTRKACRTHSGVT